MWMRAAHKAGMQHAGQLNVINVLTFTTQQAPEFTAGNARADSGG